jgi:site-specific recombinase XerD
VEIRWLLAAYRPSDNKAAGTVRIYTDAVRWLAAAHFLGETGKTRWEQVNGADVQRWVVYLLGRYSEAYACQQYRSLRSRRACQRWEIRVRGKGGREPTVRIGHEAARRLDRYLRARAGHELAPARAA